MPKIVTIQTTRALGSFFFSLGHRAITVLSLVRSQKQECRMWTPAPFFCMIVHETGGNGMPKLKQLVSDCCIIALVRRKHTQIFKRLVHIHQILRYPRAYLVYPLLSKHIIVHLVLQHRLDDLIADRLHALRDEGNLVFAENNVLLKKESPEKPAEVQLIPRQMFHPSL